LYKFFLVVVNSYNLDLFIIYKDRFWMKWLKKEQTDLNLFNLL